MNRQVHAKMIQTTAEDTVIALLQDAGYDVFCHVSTSPHNITINGKLTVAIKGALWTKHAHSKGRYQFQTRKNADVYILTCMTHAPHFFVVPGHMIGNRENVAIWSEFPSKYIGKWSEYCDAWHIIDEALAR